MDPQKKPFNHLAFLGGLFLASVAEPGLFGALLVVLTIYAIWLIPRFLVATAGRMRESLCLANQKAKQRRMERESERAYRKYLASLPPPPTKEQLFEEARTRHQSTVRLITDAGLNEVEIAAALEKAKQKYLQDMDRLMREQK